MKTILDLIAKDSKTEMPQTLVDAEIEERVKQIARSIGRKDLTLEQLAEMMGKPAPELRKELNEASVGSVKKRLVLEEIAKKEEVKVEEADILEYAEERFGTLTDDLKKTLLSNEKFLDEIEGAVLFRKTFDWIHRNADIKPGEKVKLSTLMQATGTGA
jgi:trigger factor